MSIPALWSRARALTPKRGMARRVGAASTVAALAIGVAACGSSSNNSSSTTSRTSSGGAKSTISVMTAGSVTGPSPSPQYFAVSNAAVKWINANGGAGGHQLKLSQCDDQSNPNGAATCVQKMVSQKAVACVGCNALGIADNYIKRMQPLKLAWFGPSSAQSPQEMSNPVSFPLSFAFLINAASASKSVPPTCRTTNLGIIEFPGTPEYVKYYKAALKVNGGTLAKTVLVPLKPGDFSSQAVQLMSNHPDCINIAGAQSTATALLPALKQLGVTGDKVRLFSTSALDESVCRDFYDSVCKNAVTASPFPDISSDVWANYKAAIAKYGRGQMTDAQIGSEQAQAVWAAYMAFKNVLDTARLSSVTAASFLDAANRDTAVDTGGLLPVLNFTKPFPGKGYERIFNRSAALRHVEGNAFVADPGFVDQTAVLQAVVNGS